MANGCNGHEQTNEPAPSVPDYLASPDAVFNDERVQWRYGKPPDYTKTRKYWEAGKSMNHPAGSLPEMVENLVKNWEVEASFKPRLQDWRTIDHANYTFSMNGGPPQSAEHMLQVGTYNAIIAANEYYSPEHSDFATSHKTFKRMMPTFAWEVVEVYSGPPTVCFKWRHWGDMKSDYVALNDRGQKVTARAHGGRIEIFGVTVASVDENVRLRAVHTWMDPLAMFRQIAPDGVVERESVSDLTNNGIQTDAISNANGVDHAHDGVNSNGVAQEINDVEQPMFNEEVPKVEHVAATQTGMCPFVAHQIATAHSVTSQDEARISPSEPDIVTPTSTSEAVVESDEFTTPAQSVPHLMPLPIETLLPETLAPIVTSDAPQAIVDTEAGINLPDVSEKESFEQIDGADTATTEGSTEPSQEEMIQGDAEPESEEQDQGSLASLDNLSLIVALLSGAHGSEEVVRLIDRMQVEEPEADASTVGEESDLQFHDANDGSLADSANVALADAPPASEEAMPVVAQDEEFKQEGEDWTNQVAAECEDDNASPE